MSWHFSRALEEEYWARNYLDGKLSVLWNSIPSAPDDSCSAKMKDTFHRSPFGTMFVHSEDILGEALLTWFREVFLARTFQSETQPMVSEESMESDQDCGKSLPESLAKFDQEESLWKTRQRSLFAEGYESLVTLPNWGMTVRGELYLLPTLVHHISEREFGLLPTPTASDHKGASVGCKKIKTGELSMLRYRLAADAEIKHGTLYPHPEFVEAMMGWPIGLSGQSPLATARFHEWLQQHGDC